MKWINSKRIFLLLAGLVFLSSALFSEWCFEDEDYQALLDNRAETARVLDSQETQIEQQEKQLTIAKSWQEISNGAIKQLNDWYSAAQTYWRKQNIVTGIVAGSVGVGLGIVFGLLIGAQ